MSNTTLDDVLYEFALNPAIATSRELWMARTIVNLREQLAVSERVAEAAEYFCSYQGTASEPEKYIALSDALDVYRTAATKVHGGTND